MAANQAEVADFFDVSIDTVAAWRKKGMPGTSGRYDLRAILAWLRSDGPWQHRGVESSPQTSDLTRYRSARAQLAELELEQKRRSVLPRDMARAMLSRIAALWRRYGERLGKRHGPEELLSFNEVLDETQRMIDDELGDGGDGLQTNDP